jgi:hypothetical protein
LPALYAWGATVAYPAFSAGDIWGRVAAVLALCVLGAGALTSAVHPALGRTLSIHGFVGACLLTWLLLGDALEVFAGEALRGALGALGWLLFGLGWGSARKARQALPEQSPALVPLAPREQPSLLATLLVGVLGCGAVGLLGLAWRVEAPVSALLAHSAAAAAGVWLLSAGSRVATAIRQERRLPGAGRRLSAASTALSLLSALAALGLLWWLVV